MSVYFLKFVTFKSFKSIILRYGESSFFQYLPSPVSAIKKCLLLTMSLVDSGGDVLLKYGKVALPHSPSKTNQI